MNRQKAQEAINKIVEDYRKDNGKAARNQYPASKKHIARAQELGILDMIPNAPYANHIGNTEIQLILKEAEVQVVGPTHYQGDDSTVVRSDLYKALNEVETPEPTEEAETNELINEVKRVAAMAAEEGIVWAETVEIMLSSRVQERGEQTVKVYTRDSRDPRMNANGGDYDYWTKFEIDGTAVIVSDEWSADFDASDYLGEAIRIELNDEITQAELATMIRGEIVRNVRGDMPSRVIRNFE